MNMTLLKNISYILCIEMGSKPKMKTKEETNEIETATEY